MCVIAYFFCISLSGSLYIAIHIDNEKEGGGGKKED